MAWAAGWAGSRRSMGCCRPPRAGATSPTLKPDGRAVEIQRLIGRVLRSVVRFDRLGENTLYLDCDVLEADGGTRTAAITGAYVALALAADRAARQGRCREGVLDGQVAAVSVEVVAGRVLLDLNYGEDSAADVDANLAMTSGGKFIEVQATAERSAFDSGQLQKVLSLGGAGIRRLFVCRREAMTRGSRK